MRPPAKKIGTELTIVTRYRKLIACVTLLISLRRFSFFVFVFQSVYQLLGYLSKVHRGQFRLHHTSVHQVIYVTVNLPGPPRGYGD